MFDVCILNVWSSRLSLLVSRFLLGFVACSFHAVRAMNLDLFRALLKNREFSRTLSKTLYEEISIEKSRGLITHIQTNNHYDHTSTDQYRPMAR